MLDRAVNNNVLNVTLT